jgi:SAM-dependent methyltransferase
MRYRESIENRFTARHKKCIDFSGDVKNKVILDVGCWIGWYEKFIVGKGCKFVIGIDTDRSVLRKAKKSTSVDKCEFAQASAYKLPFKSGSFDIVSMFDVLEHLPMSSDLNALSEANRVLNADGLLVISVPNDYFIIKLLDPAYFLVGHRHYAFDIIERMMEKVGFKIYKVEYGGGIVEALSMVFLYLFKHLFGMEVPFKSFLERLRDKEYQGKGFATLFIKALKD